jgi:hypothetical protein
MVLVGIPCIALSVNSMVKAFLQSLSLCRLIHFRPVFSKVQKKTKVYTKLKDFEKWAGVSPEIGPLRLL